MRRASQLGACASWQLRQSLVHLLLLLLVQQDQQWLS
jgi:hypothetical protein